MREESLFPGQTTSSFLCKTELPLLSGQPPQTRFNPRPGGEFEIYFYDEAVPVFNEGLMPLSTNQRDTEPTHRGGNFKAEFLLPFLRHSSIYTRHRPPSIPPRESSTVGTINLQ